MRSCKFSLKFHYIRPVAVLVNRLRRHPFTVEGRVRLPYMVLQFSISYWMVNMRLFLVLCVLLCIRGVLAQEKHAAKKRVARSAARSPIRKVPVRIDSFSYAIGVSYGRYMQSQHIAAIRPEDVARGLRDVLQHRPQLLTNEQIDSIVKRVAREAMDRIVTQHKKAFDSLLAKNKENPKIKTLLPGLQYEVLKAAPEGEIPSSDTDFVRVEYVGRLVDGTVFDQTAPDKPITFRINQVISGWRVALMHMHTGEAWRVYIASDLAYGDSGAGTTIPGGAGLIFDIHLRAVRKDASFPGA